MSDIAPRQWHVRAQITTTVKEGYRVGELTISCDYTDGDTPTVLDYAKELDAAHVNAVDFCADQNRALGFQPAFGKDSPLYPVRGF